MVGWLLEEDRFKTNHFESNLRHLQINLAQKLSDSDRMLFLIIQYKLATMYSNSKLYVILLSSCDSGVKTHNVTDIALGKFNCHLDFVRILAIHFLTVVCVKLESTSFLTLISL